MPDHLRKTQQPLAPLLHTPSAPGEYDIYPAFPVEPGTIASGFEALVDRIGGKALVAIDGFVGVFWDTFRDALDSSLLARRITPVWIDVSEALRPEPEIEARIAPFLGGDDPLWGTCFTGSLADFFDPAALERIGAEARQASASGGGAIGIVYGIGAALAVPDAHLVYLDLPKNELQFRSRAGCAGNLGARDCSAMSAKEIYKRHYFVDWPALGAHKASLLPAIDIIVDVQRPGEPVFAAGATLRDALARMSRNVVRVRPWFEPGPWGGSWIREHIPSLPQDVPNYAWSFELIVPENGILLSDQRYLLEISFDLLMAQEAPAMLGAAAARFGTEFPIRFDFLDTVDGGNLSVQCHPRTDYIREHFGERFTQDETYYILDCVDDARVYLGFRDDIDPAAFRAELERSHRDGTPVDVDRYVNTEPAARGDLFLIPNGTIHCSGTGSLVLEISATPYIFTFKMYDWVRRDLEGNLRPLNIPRAFDNLDFDRRGDRVRTELVSRPVVIERGDDWQVEHLPTHPDHFYDVHRITFATAVDVATDGACHVLNLVEGRSIVVETDGGMRQRFNHAETFIVPAAASAYRLVNEGDAPAKVVKAFVRPDASGTA